MALQKKVKTPKSGKAGKAKTEKATALKKKPAVAKKSEKQERTKELEPKVKPAAQKKKESSIKSSKTGAGAVHGVDRQAILRKQLIQKREEIVKEAKNEIAKYIKGESNQLVETALDDGDWSVIDLSADINLKRLETHRESLLRIDAALMKLKEGTFGICEDCGEEISAERLKAMPFAIYCRDCQEKKEEIDKVTREEAI